MKQSRVISIFILCVFIFSNLMCFVAAGAVFAADFEEQLTAKGAILIDTNSGKVLYEKEADERLKPASITKVMTLLLIMEALEAKKIDLTQMVKVSEDASKMGGSQIYLKAGESMSVESLLKSIVISSANDAAYAMGELVAGSNTAFVSMMNEKAKQLNMENTNFVNSNGLDADNHYTSARDVAIMSRELLLKHPDIKKYTVIWQDSVRNGEFVLSNTNKLIKTYQGITGLKTGSTGQALYCISASAQKDNESLIAVILGATTGNDRFSEAAKLLDYGFANYDNYNIKIKDEALEPIEVLKGQKEKVNVQIEQDLNVLIKKGTQDNVKKEIIISESLVAPVGGGQKVGDIKYYLDDELLAQIPIVTCEEVKEITFIYSLKTLLQFALMMN